MSNTECNILYVTYNLYHINNTSPHKLCGITVHFEPGEEIDGHRNHSVQLTSPPPIYKTLDFYTGKFYGDENRIAKANLRNILYKTSCL